MIKEAIMALKDRKGSSGQAIKKVAIVRRIRSHCRDLLFRPSRSPRWRKPPDSTNPSPQYIESAHPEIKFAQHSMRGALKNGVEKAQNWVRHVGSNVSDMSTNASFNSAPISCRK